MYVPRRLTAATFRTWISTNAADDINDDIVFDGKGDAQDDGDKLAAPSFVVKIGRENHATATCDLSASRTRSTEKNIFAR